MIALVVNIVASDVTLTAPWDVWVEPCSGVPTDVIVIERRCYGNAPRPEQDLDLQVGWLYQLKLDRSRQAAAECARLNRATASSRPPVERQIRPTAAKRTAQWGPPARMRHGPRWTAWLRSSTRRWRHAG